MKTLVAIAIAAPVLLVGCATNKQISTRSALDVNVTFNSEPTGAQVVMRDEVLCLTPCTRVYNLSGLSPSNDVLVNSPVSYRWVSEAKLNTSIVIRRSDVATYGTNLRHTVKRPQNAPNENIDLQYAIVLDEQAAKQRRFAAAQREADDSKTADAALLFLGAFAKGYSDAKTAQSQWKPSRTSSTCLVMPMDKDIVHVDCN